MEVIQKYLPNVYELGWSGDAGWGLAIWNTIYMTILPFIIGGAIGLFLGLMLVLMGPGGVIENKQVSWVLDKVTSIFRAIPFVILIAILASFTFLIMGTTLGATLCFSPFDLCDVSIFCTSSTSGFLRIR